jgi:hypothetical protein
MRAAHRASGAAVRYRRAVAPIPSWFKWLSWVMAALLGVCVVLQYNDPDPIRWIAIYGAGAVISIVLPRDRRVAPVGLVVGLIATAWAGYLIYRVWGVVSLSDFVGKMSAKGGAVEGCSFRACGYCSVRGSGCAGRSISMCGMPSSS